MIMETISCGYPMAPSGLGGTPLSPPATPTGTESYGPQLYAQTQYVQPGFASTQLHHSYSKYDEDANNNNHIYNSSDALNNNSRSSSSSSSSSDHDSLLSDLSSMSIAESDERFSDLSPVSESPDFLSQMSPPSPPPSSSSRPKCKKNSRSKSNGSVGSQGGGGDKTRKDSFVYDVRLPDEQILLFVPDLDLVKSHLMFAVREEVDVLKDRIVELMDRIKHLECENTILRQYASPEVLQQIQSQMPHQLQQPPHHSSTS